MAKRLSLDYTDGACDTTRRLTEAIRQPERMLHGNEAFALLIFVSATGFTDQYLYLFRVLEGRSIAGPEAIRFFIGVGRIGHRFLRQGGRTQEQGD